MKIRRFIGKRRRKAAKRLANQMAAKHLGVADRRELADFARFLQRRMTPAETRAYVLGEG